MRVDFNGSGFSAEMGNEPAKQSSTPPEKELKIKGIKHIEVLILGVFALIFALVLIPLGISVNIGVDMLQIIDADTTDYVIMFAFGAIIFFALSATLATVACCLHRKGEKNNISMIGFILSIMAYIVGSIALLYNILGIILHLV